MRCVFLQGSPSKGLLRCIRGHSDAAHDAQDAQDAAATAAQQTVPADTVVATHIHDEPVYVPEMHERQVHAADATAPGHLPMGLIAQQIAQSVKVI